jgi:hypothetical protein
MTPHLHAGVEVRVMMNEIRDDWLCAYRREHRVGDDPWVVAAALDRRQHVVG